MELIERPEINLYTYGQVIFKHAKTIQWIKNSLFNEWGRDQIIVQSNWDVYIQ